MLLEKQKVQPHFHIYSRSFLRCLANRLNVEAVAGGGKTFTNNITTFKIRHSKHTYYDCTTTEKY